RHAMPMRNRPHTSRRPRLTGICLRNQQGCPARWRDTESVSGRRDDEIRLPLTLGPVSNGEFLPTHAGPGHVRLARAACERAAAAADALSIDRRLFLQTAGGMAALLATINLAACSAQGPQRRPGATGSPVPGGGYSVPSPEQLPECEVV